MANLLVPLTDALPADGSEMPFEAWKDAIGHENWRYIQDARRAGVVVFRLDVDENGNTVHTVRRRGDAD